jgi:aspartate racemase
MIGVTGGMGPLATADFMHPVIRATPASGDAQHVPLLVSNDPRIPARPAAILDGGESPLPRLLEIHDRLLRAGATALAMPCNTAHFRHAALPEGCPVPFPLIVDLACDEAALRQPRGASVGLIATRATLAVGLFGPALGCAQPAAGAAGGRWPRCRASPGCRGTTRPRPSGPARMACCWGQIA